MSLEQQSPSSPNTEHQADIHYDKWGDAMTEADQKELEEYRHQRTNKRRQEDIECAAHEKRLDTMDTHIASNKGWLKGTASLVGIVGFVLTLFCTNIIGRLTTISDLLTDYKVMLKQHETEINNIKNDVKEIQERHKYIDQASGSFKRAR
jgi:hypothetical protein